jgi:dTDP-glucose 4,6-dehydratase|tara:strand:+ start:244 stop:1146 length:903 start_codon:yes stop_codon:yes gene_type:complete
MRALVTGGAGFIGSHIVNRFISKGYDVVVLDSLEETSDLSRIDGDIHLIVKRMERIQDLPKVDLVVNSAAETHVDYSFERPVDFINVNIIGLHNLAKHCSENNIPLIHLSTDEVIGTGEDLYEDSMLKPTNPYAFTKCAGENLLHSYGYSYGLNWNAVRLNNTYGKKQFPDKLIPKFINLINDGKKVTIHGRGLVTRNFLHVEDFVDAVETVFEKGETRNIYNVSTAEEYSIIEVTKMICETMDVTLEDVIEYVKDRPFNDPCYHSKSDKLRGLGWLPKRTLKESLPELVKYYSTKGDIE